MAKAKDVADKAADKAAEEKQVEFDTKEIKAAIKAEKEKIAEETVDEIPVDENPVVLEAFVKLAGDSMVEFVGEHSVMEKKELANVLINELKKF